MNNLDQIDFKILTALQSNGRLANSELAHSLDISTATCHRRTQQLFKEGYIKSVRAILDPQKIQRGTLITVGVILNRSTPESFSNFETAIKKIPYVLSCYSVVGDCDYFVKIRVKDLDFFNKVHSQQLLTLPEVAQLKTHLVMKEVIDNEIFNF